MIFGHYSKTPASSLPLDSYPSSIFNSLSVSLVPPDHCPFNPCVRYFTAEAPQYDLPDLRGKQRTQRLFGFLFSAERAENKKKYASDYSSNLFIILPP